MLTPAQPASWSCEVGSQGDMSRPPQGGEEVEKRLLCFSQLSRDPSATWHPPAPLIKDCCVPRKGGSAAFYHRITLRKYLPLPSLSLLNSKTGRSEIMLTEEARRLAGNQAPKCHKGAWFFSP